MSTSTDDLTARARIRNAALVLFAEHGFASTTTRAIAAAAGVSPALLRHHFGSKDGLRAAVDHEVGRVFGQALDEVAADPEVGDPISALGEVTSRLFGADLHLRAYVRRVLLEDGDTSAQLFSRLLEGTRQELRRLTERGVVLRDDADATWAPYQVLFLILGPLLLEPPLRQATDVDPFAPDVLRARSEANQRLLRHGLLASP
jgi:AcrR family transcriptional regulator